MNESLPDRASGKCGRDARKRYGRHSSTTTVALEGEHYETSRDEHDVARARTTTAEEVDVNWLETNRSTHHSRHAGHSGHGWMMIACCIPILVIAVTLVATGVVGAGLIFGAVMCTVMMAMMMAMMTGGSRK